MVNNYGHQRLNILVVIILYLLPGASTRGINLFVSCVPTWNRIQWSVVHFCLSVTATLPVRSCKHHPKFCFFPGISWPRFVSKHPQLCRYLCDLNPIFPADLNATDLCRSVTIHETVLEPGDLIFVPAGWPHQAPWVPQISSEKMRELDDFRLVIIEAMSILRHGNLGWIGCAKTMHGNNMKWQCPTEFQSCAYFF